MIGMKSIIESLHQIRGQYPFIDSINVSVFRPNPEKKLMDPWCSIFVHYAGCLCKSFTSAESMMQWLEDEWRKEYYGHGKSNDD